jgi:hypothetical protein
VHLSRLLRPDEVTSVAIPTVEQEAARDFVRAREDSRGDLMRARHRLSKLFNTNTLIGTTDQRGTAWHHRAEHGDVGTYMPHPAPPLLQRHAGR